MPEPMEKFNYFFKKVQFYASILLHRETPWFVKLLLSAGLLYIIFPLDIFPDQLPLIGILDDITIASFIIFSALKLVPPHVFDQIHKKYFPEAMDHEETASK